MIRRLLPNALLAVLLSSSYPLLALSDDRSPTRREPATLFSMARILPYYEGGKMTGVQFRQIKPGGFFDQIGLEEGDIVFSFDGQSVQSPQAAAALLRTLAEAQQPFKLGVRCASGRTRTLTWNHGLRHPVAREAPPPEDDRHPSTEAPEPEEERPNFLPVYSGDEVLGAQFSNPHGASRSMPGLRSGDVILEANGMRIDSMAALETLEEIFREPGKVELLFRDASGAEALSSFEVTVSDFTP